MNLEELRQQWTVAQTSAAAAHAFWELYAAGPGGNPSPVTDSDPALQLVLQHEMIRPGSAVLDLGCGTGRYAAWFAQKGCRVTGFDLSETAAAQARQRFREAGLPDAEFVTGDWHGMQPGALDWDRKFDLVFCHMSPAVQSYDTFERLYRCSRGWCLMAKPTFRKDAVSRYLIGKLGLTDVHRPFEEDMSYAFTYLILHGLRPAVIGLVCVQGTFGRLALIVLALLLVGDTLSLYAALLLPALQRLEGAVLHGLLAGVVGLAVDHLVGDRQHGCHA
jgi:SAM-dependent methyltransferase